MQPEFLQHLDEAVAEVFSLMLGRSCAPSTLAFQLSPGFTASVIFSGSLQGGCAVHLDLRSAGELADELTGSAPDPTMALAADTVGELCNMIAGSWKSRLAPDLSACELSSPTVLPGTPRQPPIPTLTRFYRFADRCLTLELTLA